MGEPLPSETVAHCRDCGVQLRRTWLKVPFEARKCPEHGGQRPQGPVDPFSHITVVHRRGRRT
jgi:hypothetical protein